MEVLWYGIQQQHGARVALAAPGGSVGKLAPSSPASVHEDTLALFGEAEAVTTRRRHAAIAGTARALPPGTHRN
eukprot:scaffold9128_cov126-Isochrysis_galbana.AAC.5